MLYYSNVSINKTEPRVEKLFDFTQVKLVYSLYPRYFRNQQVFIIKAYQMAFLNANTAPII